MEEYWLLHDTPTISTPPVLSASPQAAFTASQSWRGDCSATPPGLSINSMTPDPVPWRAPRWSTTAALTELDPRSTARMAGVIRAAAACRPTA